MDNKRIENAINILKKAIDEEVSVKKASVMSGFADTYFKNTKRELKKKADSNNSSIDKKLYAEFEYLYSQYIDDKIENIDYNKQSVKGEQTNFTASNETNSGTFEWKSPYPPNHIKSVDELLERCNVDLDVWKVNDFLVNKWDVTSWKKGFAETVENFQVKAKLVKKVDDEVIKTAAEIFNQLTENYTPPVLKVKSELYKQETDENNMLEISIFDFHLGKLGWNGEVKSEYNIKIASERFITSITKLINRSMGFGFKKILFPVGNDFLNVDNMNYTTAGNTPQLEDAPWQQTFKLATELLVKGIDLMKQTGAEVDVVIVPGNHDYERSFYLGSFLEAWYNNDDTVNVDNSATPRKYYKYGNLLLGLSHGKYEKQDSLPLLMATENKKEWGETLFHEWHLGHIHRKKNYTYGVNYVKNNTVNEDLGVTVRYLSSLSGDESWHNKKGFVGTTNAAEGFIWNEKTGLIGQVNTNII
jgi:hypothetical protein